MFDVGDLVVCVNALPCPVHGPVGLGKGEFYRVRAIKTGACKQTGFVATGIKVDRNNGPIWHHVCRFRKIDAPDTEVSRLIRACKPVYEGQPA